ncbi:MAG TPA: hypothetical protein VGD91_08280 [Trebonia sp.]
MADDPMAALRDLSLMFADPPKDPHQAMARLELLTCGSSTAVSSRDIRIAHDGGVYSAEYEDAGFLWHGEGPSTVAALLGLLADRIGYRAIVTPKYEETEQAS